jgi:electron transport complex protein RnfD
LAFANGVEIFIADAVTGATPLGILKESALMDMPVSEAMKQMPDHMHLFLGQMGGSLGEISAVALLLGFIFMLYKKIITWHIPVTILATVFAFTGTLWLIDPVNNATPGFSCLTAALYSALFIWPLTWVTSP